MSNLLDRRLKTLVGPRHCNNSPLLSPTLQIYLNVCIIFQIFFFFQFSSLKVSVSPSKATLPQRQPVLLFVSTRWAGKVCSCIFTRIHICLHVAANYEAQWAMGMKPTVWMILEKPESSRPLSSGSPTSYEPPSLFKAKQSMNYHSESNKTESSCQNINLIFPTANLS